MPAHINIATENRDLLSNSTYRLRLPGFTLIELLVVISIIALLIAILLPTLRRAREQVKVVTCMSNERQMVMATILYANDTNGFFPASSIIYDPNAPRWPGQINEYLTGTDVFYCPVQLGNLAGPINTYIGNGATWVFHFDQYGFGERATRVEDCRQPSSVALITESLNDLIWAYEPDPLIASTQPGFYYALALPMMGGRHLFGGDAGNGLSFGQDNVAFVDGHASSYDMKEYVQNAAGWMYNYPFHPANTGLGFPMSGVATDGPPGPKGEFWFVPWW